MELSDIFGAGAVQTSTHLIIQKSSFEFNNTAESLLKAILTSATSINSQSLNIRVTPDELISRESSEYLQSTVVVELSKPDAEDIDPDDY